MAVKDFLAPTRGRIVLFLIIFVLVIVYDTLFAPFPGSPVMANLDTQEGATSLVLYVLILPYILSCLIPAFFGLRKRKFFRLVSLRRFFYTRPVTHESKPSRQQTFTFPMGTTTVESKLPLAPGERQEKPEKQKPPEKAKSKTQKKK